MKSLKCKVGVCSQCGQDIHGAGTRQTPRPGQVIICINCLKKMQRLTKKDAVTPAIVPEYSAVFIPPKRW